MILKFFKYFIVKCKWIIILLFLNYCDYSFAQKNISRIKDYYWNNFGEVKGEYLLNNKIGTGLGINSEIWFNNYKIDIIGIGSNFSVLYIEEKFNFLMKLYLTAGVYYIKKDICPGEIWRADTQFKYEIGICRINTFKNNLIVEKIAPTFSFGVYKNLKPNKEDDSMFIYPKISFTYGTKYKYFEIGFNIGFEKYMER